MFGDASYLWLSLSKKDDIARLASAASVPVIELLLTF